MNETQENFISVELGNIPDLLDRHIFFFSSKRLQALRWIRNQTKPVPALKKVPSPSFKYLLAESRTPLYSSRLEERFLEEGKIKNLKVAAEKLDGLLIDDTFSFWNQIGKPGAKQGYVMGREIRFGCIIPAIAGGLCQLTGALYECALLSGCTILERHKHTRKIAGVPYQATRDATVFWNYVDLRFFASEKIRIKVEVLETELVVAFYGKNPMQTMRTVAISESAPLSASDCLKCEQISCHYHKKTNEIHTNKLSVLSFLQTNQLKKWLRTQETETELSLSSYKGRKAFLIQWALVKLYLTVMRRLLLPFWPLARVNFFLAKQFAALIPTSLLDREPLWIHQSLALPLWQSGKLKNRLFHLWLDYLPIRETQARLDSCPWPGSSKDFRLSENLMEQEERLFSAALKIYTPHRLLHKLVPGSNWISPEQLPPNPELRNKTLSRHLLLFPGPNLDREGAREARFAAEELKLDIYYYSGKPSTIPWNEILALVHPTIFESRTEIHQQCLSRGIPAVVSDGVGLEPNKYVSIVLLWKKDSIVQALMEIKGKNYE